MTVPSQVPPANSPTDGEPSNAAWPAHDDVSLNAARAEAASELRDLSDAIFADLHDETAGIFRELRELREELQVVQQMAQEAVQDAHLLSNTIFEQTHGALFVLRGRSCVACNRNALRMFGLELNDVIGHWPGFLFSTDPLLHDAARSSFAFDAAMLHGRHAEEAVRRRQNGDTFWCELTLSSFRVRGQTHLLVVVRDISGRKKAEEQLRLLAGVFQNIQEGVAILDRRGVVREANPAFERVACKSLEQIISLPLQEVLHWTHEDLPRVLRNVAAGEPWAGRIRLGDSKRRPTTFLVSLSPAADCPTEGAVIALFSDVTRIEKTQRRLRRQALHDTLTGLPNRRYCREQIQWLIEHSASARTSFAVCFLDLDDFKLVNDSLGHKAGDRLLLTVARRLRRAAGDDAFVARFGGDEFAILLPNVDPLRLRIAETADSVLKALRRPFQLAGTQAFVGVSMGVTIFPDHAGNVDALLQNADVAMYAAKDAGKNQVCVFSDDLKAVAEDRNHIQLALRRALGENQISIEYQPQVWTSTGRLAGCEALARWRNSAGELISPSRFIPIAEQTGLITALGDFVLQTACRQAVAWRLSGCLPDRCAVNLSPRQLRHPRFVERVEEILAETGARPEWLELEITENAVMEDVHQAMRVMDQLAQLGIRLAIDDFGTGYSSLSYLKSFNIHSLKIDQSFVRDLPDDESALAIARSIVSLAKGRGLHVVAEGVETYRQFDCLKEMGCDLVQGFLVSPPLSPSEFAEWTRQQQFSGPMPSPVGNSSPFSFTM